jgi:hypothetical protein
LDVLGHDAAGNDVVGQDGGELGLVGEESVQILLGHLGKRRVRRREYGERAFALQSVDQPRLLQRDGECLEVAGRNGGVDDVLGLDRPLRSGTRVLDGDLSHFMVANPSKVGGLKKSAGHLLCLRLKPALYVE